MYELAHFMHTTTLHLEIIHISKKYYKKAFAQHLVWTRALHNVDWDGT